MITYIPRLLKMTSSPRYLLAFFAEIGLRMMQLLVVYRFVAQGESSPAERHFSQQYASDCAEKGHGLMLERFKDFELAKNEAQAKSLGDAISKAARSTREMAGQKLKTLQDACTEVKFMTVTAGTDRRIKYKASSK